MRAGSFVLLACLLGAWGALGYEPLCQSYTVASGDSVWSIANSLGITQESLVGALAQCIRYVEGQTVLQVGQQVCVPPYYPDCQYVSSSGGSTACKYYTVQTGDTLSGVAAKFDIYLQDLQDLNSDIVDSASPMRVGLKLRLPPWDSKNCPDPNSGAASCRYYVVKSGDYIAYIAAGFSVSVDDLLSVNNDFTASSILSPGQRVKIPPYPSTCTTTTAASFPTDGVTTCRAYVVVKGDSLASIAVKFGTTTANLISLNPELTDPSLLQPGKQVKIPVWTSACSTPIIVTGTPSPPAPPSPPTPPPSPTAPASPKASPSPAASPSPVSASSPVPASLTIPSTGVSFDLNVTGASVAEFNIGLSTLWVHSMANLTNVPAEFVNITSVFAVPAPTAASTRRLRAVNDTIEVSTHIASSSPNATAELLQAAQSSGALESALASMKLTIASSSSTLNVTTSSPAASPSPSPSPAPTTEAAASGNSSSNVGAIVGGVVGGVAGCAVLAGVVVVLMRRRRTGAAGSARAAGATATLSTRAVKGLHFDDL